MYGEEKVKKYHIHSSNKNGQNDHAKSKVKNMFIKLYKVYDKEKNCTQNLY